MLRRDLELQKTMIVATNTCNRTRNVTAHDDALQQLLSRCINNGSSQLIGHSSNHNCHYHQIESAFNLLIEAEEHKAETVG